MQRYFHLSDTLIGKKSRKKSAFNTRPLNQQLNVGRRWIKICVIINATEFDQILLKILILIIDDQFAFRFIKNADHFHAMIAIRNGLQIVFNAICKVFYAVPEGIFLRNIGYRDIT
jgi:hypothetical protein